jgi:hypothetical protein
VQPLGSSQHFMEPEGSLPSLQELSTCTYPEPDQSSPQHSTEIRYRLEVINALVGYAETFYRLLKMLRAGYEKYRKEAPKSGSSSSYWLHRTFC